MPNFAEHIQKARQLIKNDRVSAAFDFLQTLKKNADERDLWRVHELFGEVFFAMGDARGAATAYLNAFKNDTFLTAQMQHFSNYLFALQYLPDFDNEQLFAEHLFYGELAAQLPALPLPAARERGAAEGKIRVGYLATNFAPSAAACFFSPLLTGFNRQKFAVFAYAIDDLPEVDPKYAADICRAAKFRQLPPDYAAAAEMIRRDNLDILVELGGHSAGGRGLIIAAGHVAPVQISAIGYMGTTGLPAVDYVFADKIMWQSGDEKCFTEQPLNLPQAFCFAPAETPTRYTPPQGVFTFANLGNFMKITDKMLALWQKILAAAPQSRLILQDAASIPERIRQMRRRVAQAGFDMSRVEIRGARKNFCREYEKINLVLDTSPYPGGMMTATALCHNVPVLAKAGGRYGARFAEELLAAANCREFIAKDDNDYFEQALRATRGEMPTAIDPTMLTDKQRYIKNVEQAYEEIYSRSLGTVH